MHTLLERQLRRYFGATGDSPDMLDSFTPVSWLAFLSAIDSAYVQADVDRAMLERSLELSSAELMEFNAELRVALISGEQLREEVQLRAAEVEGILAAAPRPILLAETDGSILRASLAVAHVLGWSPDDLVGRTIRTIVPDMPSFSDPEDGDWPTTAASLELGAARRDGSVFPAEIIFAAMLDPAGGRRIVLELVDLTERRRADRERREGAQRAEAARQLAQRNQRLEELDQMKDELIASVSHEMRTPITCIISFVELLDGHVGETEGPVYVKVIRRNLSRLTRIVEDLLEVARLGSGGVDLERKPTSIPSVLRLCVEAALPVADSGGVLLTCRSGEGPLIETDGTRLAQVLDNMLSNAIKFTPYGGSVTAEALYQEEAWVVRISDTGIGIPEGEVDRVLGRFYRASNAREHSVLGTGLGLAIVSDLVEALGGQFSLSSVEGMGTTVAVRLPDSCQIEVDG